MYNIIIQSKRNKKKKGINKIKKMSVLTFEFSE